MQLLDSNKSQLTIRKNDSKKVKCPQGTKGSS